MVNKILQLNPWLSFFFSMNKTLSGKMHAQLNLITTNFCSSLAVIFSLVHLPTTDFCSFVPINFSLVHHPTTDFCSSLPVKFSLIHLPILFFILYLRAFSGDCLGGPLLKMVSSVWNLISFQFISYSCNWSYLASSHRSWPLNWQHFMHVVKTSYIIWRFQIFSCSNLTCEWNMPKWKYLLIKD